ncbi:hypothetical protein KDI_01990 [Dictyobacter arantiisoli]|uniref:Peptidase C51 domain-containing protein n=2 Tax=Dictyobacter arantiisoli TaxID=2014874 RepID=A0A5A5T5X9_9CHLR|nr:hypothetical protein KDI_01990 [Dictyobacter arantiisoli]
MDQASTPDTTTPYALPGEAQVPMVPSPMEGSLMPDISSPDASPKMQTRAPIFIPSTGKKSTGSLRPPRGRGLVINIGVAVVLLVVVIGALVAVLPAGNGQASALGKLFNPTQSMVQSKKNDTALIQAQSATATAVTQDGYDAGNQIYAGVTSAPSTTVITASDTGSLNRFFYGQCTYWANMRYHQLTGHWVPWLGNAGDWAYQAPAYGWKTSSVPNPNGPSIIVLAPYTQGAGSYGHVAVVETGVSNPYNGVSTSNWNWNGHWASEDWVTFYPGAGITFVWFPGA